MSTNLTSGVPEQKIDRFSIHHHVGAVVIKDGWHILVGERVRDIRNKHTCLADGTVTYNDTFDGLQNQVEVKQAK